MRVLILLFAISAVFAQHQFSYDGYKLYSLTVHNDQHLQFLKKLHDDPLVYFWSPLRISEQPVDVMVSPQGQNMFALLMTSNDIPYEILIDNVETVFAEERLMQRLGRKSPNERISFDKYNRFDEIEQYLKDLAQDYPNTVALETIGQSFENRALMVIQISSNRTANKPIVFIDAGIHGNEWIGPAVAQYVVQQLVENPKHGYLLDKVDWHIVPLLNPDGYEYTHERQRLWRKTRSIQKDEDCVGTDGNRNFGYHWGESGSSPDPCSDTYMGPKPFSESETHSISTYINGWKHSIKLYLTFHSFGNLILYPWSYTSELPHDNQELFDLGTNVSKAIVQAGGDEYTVGSSANVIYDTAGSSDDWAKGDAGIELSYTIELPRGGLMGFGPLPHRILPIVKETFEGIVVYGQYVAEKFGKSLSMRTHTAYLSQG